MNKVYYIGGKYEGCNYARLYMIGEQLGWKGMRKNLNSDAEDLIDIKYDIADTDIALFHRPEIHYFHVVAKILKEAGKKIVFDNDDTFLVDKTHPFWNRDERGFICQNKKKNKLLYNFITNADLVTTTTETLAKEYRKYNSNVVVLPNCVQPKDWGRPKRNKGKKIRIGLVGSVAYSMDFDIIKDIIRKLDKRDDVQIVMFGLPSKEVRKKNKLVDEVYETELKFWDSLENLEHVPWCKMKDYIKTLNNLRLDIMLIPRKDCYFDKCKSNIKYLEAAMCKIPVIASSFEDSPYEELDGTIGIKVKEDEDWMVIIEDLIVNKKKRRAIGKAAYKYVIKNYNINKRYKLWEEEYNKLIK